VVGSGIADRAETAGAGSSLHAFCPV
jgi:hypothetical protein